MLGRTRLKNRRLVRRSPPPHAAASDLAGPSLVVATYNVHTCVGVDRRYDPGRVAAVLCELGADIIGLQEVDARQDGPAPLDQERFLAAVTGLTVVSGPPGSRYRGRFGNAILTRLPVLAVRHIDLAIPGCEPRGAIDVDLAFTGRVLRVVATHFGLRGTERHLQTRRLLATLAATGGDWGGWDAAENDANGLDRDPLLMMGDLNEWRGRRGGIPALDRALGRAPAPRTFPSWCPLLPLDRIYATAPAILRDFRVHRSPLARLASDHLPLRARLALPASQAIAVDEAAIAEHRALVTTARRALPA
jgi:endonuclease/exonuclease/phosphatase family metal-dependent hydrolase